MVAIALVIGLSPLAAAETDASHEPFTAEIRQEGFLYDVTISECQFNLVRTHSYQCVRPSQSKTVMINADLATVGRIDVKTFDGKLLLTFQPPQPTIWGRSPLEEYDVSHVIRDCTGREYEQIENNTLLLFLPTHTDRSVVDEIVERQNTCSD